MEASIEEPIDLVAQRSCFTVPRPLPLVPQSRCKCPAQVRRGKSRNDLNRLACCKVSADFWPVGVRNGTRLDIVRGFLVDALQLLAKLEQRPLLPASRHAFTDCEKYTQVMRKLSCLCPKTTSLPQDDRGSHMFDLTPFGQRFGKSLGKSGVGD